MNSDLTNKTPAPRRDFTQVMTGGNATIRFETEESAIEQLLPAKVIAGLRDEASKGVDDCGIVTGVYFLKDSVGADGRSCLATYCPGEPPRYTCLLFQCPYSSLNGEAEQDLLEKWGVTACNMLMTMGVDPAEVFEDMPGEKCPKITANCCTSPEL